MTGITVALQLTIYVQCVMHELCYLSFICSQNVSVFNPLSAKRFRIINVTIFFVMQHIFSIAAFPYLLVSEALIPAEESNKQSDAQ